MADKNWPLYEVFLRPRNGLSHKHVGSLHAIDDDMALQNARDVYTRRGEALSSWVVPSKAIVASEPGVHRGGDQPKLHQHQCQYNAQDTTDDDRPFLPRQGTSLAHVDVSVNPVA